MHLNLCKIHAWIIAFFISGMAFAQVPVAEVSVTFELHAPELPEQSDVYIAGNLPELGNWNPAKVKMKPLGNHRWSFTIQAKTDGTIEYKYTLGSWAREGADAQGKPLKNYAIEVESKTMINNTIHFWTTGSPTPIVGQVTGTACYHRQLQSEGLLPRDVVVWLPPGYENSRTRYPVVYMHDGQNLIDPATSAFGVDWQIDESLTELIKLQQVQPVIVVGIFNTRQRSLDYLPGPQGTRYQQFVCDELKPLVDKTYRTRPGRRSTAIGGSSAGGICAFTMAWERPDVFSKAICMSPAVQYQRTDGKITVDYLPQFKNAPRPRPTPLFYLDNGGVGLDSHLQAGIDKLLDELKHKGLQPEHDFVWRHFPKAQHDEAAWGERFPAIMKRLFPAK